MTVAGADVIGVELAGTGLRYSPEAKDILSQATLTRPPAGLRELLWQPAELYPAEVLTGALSAPGVAYEGPVTANWSRRDFPDAGRRGVPVPVQYSAAEHERVWDTSASGAGRYRRPVRCRAAGHGQRNAGQRAQSQRRALGAELPPAGVVICRRMYRRRCRWRGRSGGGLMRVGFIGLGSQGGPMARRIVEGGFELTLWARRAASLEPYADTAAKTAGTPAELGAASDLVCLCVVGDDDVARSSPARTVCWPAWHPAASSPSTAPCTPTPAREIAELAAAKGVSVIDAPVSGGGPAVEAGTLLVMIGGAGSRCGEGAPGVRHLCRSDRASGPAGQRAGRRRS